MRWSLSVGQVPQRVLERIVAGNRTWCLVEYPEIEVEEYG